MPPSWPRPNEEILPSILRSGDPTNSRFYPRRRCHFNKQKLEMAIEIKIKVIGILPGHVIMTHVKKYEETFIIGRVSTVGTQQRSDLSKVANLNGKINGRERSDPPVSVSLDLSHEYQFLEQWAADEAGCWWHNLVARVGRWRTNICGGEERNEEADAISAKEINVPVIGR